MSVPLKRGGAKSLIALCRVAPYGKGTDTLVDTRVRNTFELDPGKFRLSAEWDAVELLDLAVGDSEPPDGCPTLSESRMMRVVRLHGVR